MRDDPEPPIRPDEELEAVVDDDGDPQMSLLG